MNEYSTEKFIQQYEHIKKLQLLSDNELNHLKRKRAHFEVAIKSDKDIQPFIEYIKYESILLKKFNQIPDGKALYRSMCVHIRDIFKQAVKRFQHNRKLWSDYIKFTKISFPNSVTSIYQDMLAFHRTDNDFIEAANYEMSKKQFFLAENFLVRAINDKKKNALIVALLIECFLKQADVPGTDAEFKERCLKRVTMYFENYVKSTKDVQIYINMLNKIQNISLSMGFQNKVIKYLLIKFPSRPEVWNLLADRHLNGLFLEEIIENKNPMTIPFNIRLVHALTIYDKSLEMVSDEHKTQMYDSYLTKLMELDLLNSNMDDYSHKCVKYEFTKTLNSGYDTDCLSERFFIQYLKLCIMDNNKSQEQIEKIISNGSHLYPHSMGLYEIAIKFYFKAQKYDEISSLFKQAIKHNEKDAIALYEFLCHIYLQNSNDKERLRKAIMDAIESNNMKLSSRFQEYILEYYAQSNNIKKAREDFTQILKSKNVNSISLKLFTTMIKIENTQLKPDHTIIFNCYERATSMFGRNHADVSSNLCFSFFCCT